MRRKNRNKKKKIKIFITTLILCILLPVIAYCSYLTYLLYFRSTPTIVSTGNSNSVDDQSGIENIVLFGVDSRSSTDPGRTDSIIIATLNKNTKTIKLTSIMRDLYVQIGNTKSLGRINTAYSKGGPEMTLETLNNNFGLDLHYYAIIDFHAFQDLVDKIGGIDIEVKDYEVTEINKYIDEVNGSKSTLLKGPGLQHLNGQQALSYSRIRHVGNGDFERTERQRTVLKCISGKIKKTNILKLPQLLNILVSYTQTNVPLSKILSLGLTAYKYNSSIETMRLPVDGYYENQTVNGAAVLVPDISANSQFLKDFINDLNTSTASKPKPDIPNYENSKVSSKVIKEKKSKAKEIKNENTITTATP